MPDLGSATFSPTDASNNTGTQPSWSGSAAPSTIDDAGRALQGAITREWQLRSFLVTAGGTANAKTLAHIVAPGAYITGQKYAFISNTANTSTCTLNVNSLGAKTIKKDVAGVLTALSSGDMATGQYVEVTYNGTDFIWTNWQGASSVSLGANTFTAAQTISIDDAATNTVTDILKLAHSTSGTAVASFGAGLLYQLEDAAGTLTDAASIDAVWVDPTNASEDSAISFKTMIAGSAKAEAARIAQGMVLGSPTGGDKGAGTINVTAIYDDNVQIRAQAWEIISTLTPSAVATVEQTGLSAYRAIRITGVNIIPATDNVEFYIRISSDGSSYLTTNYDVTARDGNSSTSSVAFALINPSSGGSNVGNAASDGGLDFQVVLSSFNAAQKTKVFGQFVFGKPDGTIVMGTTRGWHTAQTAMQALRFLFSSGNIASGTIVIEGQR